MVSKFPSLIGVAKGLPPGFQAHLRIARHRKAFALAEEQIWLDLLFYYAVSTWIFSVFECVWYTVVSLDFVYIYRTREMLCIIHMCAWLCMTCHTCVGVFTGVPNSEPCWISTACFATSSLPGGVERKRSSHHSTIWALKRCVVGVGNCLPSKGNYSNKLWWVRWLIAESSHRSRWTDNPPSECFLVSWSEFARWKIQWENNEWNMYVAYSLITGKSQKYWPWGYARQINVEGTSASLQLDGPERGRWKMAEFNVRGLSTLKPTKIRHLSFVLLDSRALI